jgi:hypothetical protein
MERLHLKQPSPSPSHARERQRGPLPLPLGEVNRSAAAWRTKSGEWKLAHHHRIQGERADGGRLGEPGGVSGGSRAVRGVEVGFAEDAGWKPALRSAQNLTPESRRHVVEAASRKSGVGPVAGGNVRPVADTPSRAQPPLGLSFEGSYVNRCHPAPPSRSDMVCGGRFLDETVRLEPIDCGLSKPRRSNARQGLHRLRSAWIGEHRLCNFVRR